MMNNIKNWYQYNILSYLIFLLPFFYLIGQGVFNSIFHLLCLLGMLFFFKEFRVKQIDKFYLIYTLLIFSLVLTSLFRVGDKYIIEALLQTKYLFWIYLVLFLVNKVKIDFLAIKILYLIFILILSFILFHSIYQILNFDSSYGDSFVGYRLYLPFTDEQILGYYSFFILPSLLFFTSILKKTIFTKMFITVSVLVVIIFSGERSALLSILIFISIYSFYAMGKIRRILSFLIYSVILSLLVIQIMPNEKINEYKFRIFQTVNEVKSIEKTSYFKHYYTSIEIFKDNIFIGSGINSYRDICKNPKYDFIATEKDR